MATSGLIFCPLLCDFWSNLCPLLFGLGKNFVVFCPLLKWPTHFIFGHERKKGKKWQKMWPNAHPLPGFCPLLENAETIEISTFSGIFGQMPTFF